MRMLSYRPLAVLATTLAVAVLFSAQLLAQSKLTIEPAPTLLVKKVPFKITAPSYINAKFVDYTWLHPSVVQSEESEKGSVLTVTKAPSGEFTVKCKIIVQDKDGVFSRTFHQVTFVVGEVPPGPDPGPDPGPTPTPETPLQRSIREAYAAESDSDKLAQARAMATVYREAASQVKAARPATIGPVWKAIEAGARAAKVNGKLLKVQTVIQKEVWDRLPKKSTDALDDSKRALIETLFNDTSVALDRLGPKEEK